MHFSSGYILEFSRYFLELCSVCTDIVFASQYKCEETNIGKNLPNAMIVNPSSYILFNQ